MPMEFHNRKNPLIIIYSNDLLIFIQLFILDFNVLKKNELVEIQIVIMMNQYY